MELSEAKKVLKEESKYNESLNNTSNELIKNKNLHWNEPYLSNFEIDIHRRTKVNQAIDTVLKALDNSISKDDIRKKMEELEKIRDGFLSERKGCIFNTEKINCCTFARNILFDLIEE